jgi:hypothetical protein
MQIPALGKEIKMGYEVELIIGKTGSFITDEHKRGEPTIDSGGNCYRPRLKDENGKYILTGRKEIWFNVMATIDLCKPGNYSNMCRMSENEGKNTDKDVFIYFYLDDEMITSDRYDKEMRPVPINDVLTALKEDIDSDPNYRRFHWAYALLSSMAKDPDELEVLFFGH